MRARSLEAAKAELEEAIEYYGKQSQRLGERFKRAVDQAIGRCWRTQQDGRASRENSDVAGSQNSRTVWFIALMKASS
jgi:hypothetical protein